MDINNIKPGDNVLVKAKVDYVFPQSNLLRVQTSDTNFYVHDNEVIADNSASIHYGVESSEQLTEFNELMETKLKLQSELETINSKLKKFECNDLSNLLDRIDRARKEANNGN